MEQRPGPAADQPRSEPEIIPPDRSAARPRRDSAAAGVQRIYVARVGPFGFVLLALAIALLTAVVLVVLLGAFLIAIPLAAVLLAIGVIAGFMRRRPG